MKSHRTLVAFTIALSIAVLVAPAPLARAAETPRRGGVLLAAIAADAPAMAVRKRRRSMAESPGWWIGKT